MLTKRRREVCAHIHACRDALGSMTAAEFSTITATPKQVQDAYKLLGQLLLDVALPKPRNTK